jgi:hypothetical protein
MDAVKYNGASESIFGIIDSNNFRFEGKIRYLNRCGGISGIEIYID